MTQTIPPPPPARPPEPPGAGPARRHTVLAWVFSILGIVLVVVVLVGLLVHLPYVIISPGSATPLDGSVVSIEGAPTYPHGASVQFLTVRVSTSDPSLWRLARAWLDPDRDVEKRSTVVGCLTDTENETFNSQLMDQSQNDAKYVALTRLGYSVTTEPGKILVVEVCQGVPAYGKLHTGDQIVAVDGHAVASNTEVGPLVQQHEPGEPISVGYERNGTAGTTTIDSGRVVGAGTPSPKCVAVRRPTPGTPCLGISTQLFTAYHFPIDVRINTDRVGGPSAGLAFTLAVIDDLTPGALTGGRRVAVTGAIAPDGSVGEVGGVEQKAITARTNGIQLMIVPKAELKDARRGAGNVRVVGVSTVDDALAALQKAGGAPVPPPPSTAARS